MSGDDLIPPSPKYDPTATPPPDDAALFAENEPFELFERWFKEAKEKEPNDPNGMALATADASGFPDVRMVLMKSFEDGASFSTPTRKARRERSSAKTSAPRSCFIGSRCAARSARAA
jgi:pyridoxamine 5'-phosphate oxidase